MTEHPINIDTKYFEPTQQNQITLLLFNKQVITDYKPGDTIKLQNAAYTVTKKIKNIEIKSFGDITDKEAQKAGFLNKDFLKDELIQRFRIDGLNYTLGIDDLLLFCIHLQENKPNTIIFNSKKYKPIYYTLKEELDDKEI